MKIVVVCAMKEEYAAVQAGLGANAGARFEVIRAGVGPVSAARVARELAARAEPPDVVISTGFCGGLIDELKVGDIVVGGDVEYTESISCASDRPDCADAAEFARTLESSLKLKCARVFWGKTICSKDAVATVGAKRRLGQRASVVDMESYALATQCNSRVVFVRVVSDSVTDELPAEVGEFLDAAGNVRAGSIARFIIKKPTNFLRLMELKKRSDIAAKALTEAWRAIRDM